MTHRRNQTVAALVFTSVIFGASPVLAQLSLQITLDFGLTELVNTSDQPVGFDAYTVTSENGYFDPDLWSGLHDQIGSWDAADNSDSFRLTEFQPEAVSSLGAGDRLAVGPAYAPPVSPLTPDIDTVTFQYTQPTGEIVDGVVDLVTALSLVVDRGSGNVTIQENASPNAPIVQMDGYTISSPSGALSGDWSSLQDQGVLGWDEADNSDNHRVTEFNPADAPFFQESTLGSLFRLADPPSTIGEEVPEDIAFQYTTANGRILDGPVTYTGAVNNVVLSIDPDTGAATIQNQSQYFDIEIDGYTITSNAGVLDPDGWSSLEDQSLSDWDEADNSDNFRLTEFNPAGVLPLDGGGVTYDLGAPFDVSIPLSIDDLSFEFLLADGESVSGMILLASAGGCFIPPGTILGDLDLNGTVEFADFLTLADNFGQMVETYQEGDTDCNGTVQFADFLTLADNFGMSTTTTAASVPEPGCSILLVFGCLTLLLARPRR